MHANAKTVLVLDDDDDLRDCMSNQLRAAGYDVFSAGDVEHALALVHRHEIDVVLVDIVMQGCPRGLDLISAIHSDFSEERPRIIASASFSGFAEDALQRGAWTFLPKPVTPGNLQTAVEAAIAGTEPPTESTREVAARAWHFRNRAATHAEAVFRELDARHPEFRDRAERGARWASNYLGVRHVIIGGLLFGRLRVEVSNDPSVFPVGEFLDDRLPLCRDVLETSARLILPDVRACGALAARVQDSPVRCFAAVPLIAGNGLAFGVLCVFDERSGGLDVEDLAHLEHFGRRMSALTLGGGLGISSRFFETENVLSADGFAEIFGTELRRIRSIGGSMELAMISLTRHTRDGAWLEATSRASRGPRRAIGAFGHQKLGLYVTARDTETALRELQTALAETRELLGAIRAGVVSAGGSQLPNFSEHEVLRLAHALADRASPSDLARLVVRAEPLRATVQS